MDPDKVLGGGPLFSAVERNFSATAQTLLEGCDGGPLADTPSAGDLIVGVNGGGVAAAEAAAVIAQGAVRVSPPDVWPVVKQRILSQRSMTRSRRTPFLAACAAGHREVAGLMLVHGSDPFARDEDGLSALNYETTPHVIRTAICATWEWNVDWFVKGGPTTVEELRATNPDFEAFVARSPWRVYNATDELRWNTTNHGCFPAAFRNAARTMLLAAARHAKDIIHTRVSGEPLAKRHHSCADARAGAPGLGSLDAQCLEKILRFAVSPIGVWIWTDEHTDGATKGEEVKDDNVDAGDGAPRETGRPRALVLHRLYAVDNDD